MVSRKPRSVYRAFGSRMRKNILGVPALQVELRPRRQKFETGLRQFGAALAREHGIEPFAQRMQMQHVGGRIGQLRLAQGLRAPVARLLLLRQIDIEHLANQIFQAMAVGVGAAQPRCDLGAVHRLRHHAEGVVKCGEIEPREMKNFCHLRIGQQRFQIRRVGMILSVILGDLHHVGAAVAVRQLHHAEPVAMRVQPHRLGIDRHLVGVAGEIWQIAAMQAYGHEGQPRCLGSNRRETTYRSNAREASGRHALQAGKITLECGAAAAWSARRAYLARSCPMALSQFSMWKVLAILASLMVWISTAMILKLLPECGTPNSSPEGVPVTSPRTITRSPATSTSLMSNFMSGMVFAKLLTTLIEVSRPQHSPANSRRRIRNLPSGFAPEWL